MMLDPKPIKDTLAEPQEILEGEDASTAYQDKVDWIQALEESRWACEGFLFARQQGD